MKQQVLFIQGGGEGVHDHWDDKLVASLERELGDGYAVRYPRLPNEADPQYAAWSGAIVEELDRLRAGALLVGHSIGAAVLVHVLARHRPLRPLGGIFLIAAPFLGTGGWPADDIEPIDDFSPLLPAGIPVHLYHGDADEEVPLAHVRLYAQAIPGAVVRILAQRNHQLDEDLSEVASDVRALGGRARI